MTPTTPDPHDLEQIQAIVRDVQEGFNTNDASLMNAHLADDAIVVNARGAVLSGRAAIQKVSEDARRRLPERVDGLLRTDRCRRSLP